MRQDPKRTGATEAGKAASQHPVVKGKQATVEQLRMAEITGSGDGEPADMQRLIQQVMELTKKTHDDASIALHDCDFDTEAAVQFLLDGGEAGEWTTFRSKKAKATSSGSTSFSQFGALDHGRGRRAGRGGRSSAENGGFGEGSAFRGGSRGRSDEDRPSYRGRGTSRSRGGGRNFSRGGRGRSAEPETTSWSSKPDTTEDWGNALSSAAPVTTTTAAASSAEEDWGSFAQSSDNVAPPVTMEWHEEPQTNSWSTAPVSTAPSTEQWGTPQPVIDTAPLAIEDPIPVVNGDVSLEAPIHTLTEEIGAVTLREGCIIGEATASEPHHLLFPESFCQTQACRIRRSEIPHIPVEMPHSSLLQSAADLGIVFGSIASPEPPAVTQSPTGYSQERHDFVGETGHAVTSEPEILSLTTTSQDLLLHQQSPMTSAHINLASMAPMTSSMVPTTSSPSGITSSFTSSHTSASNSQEQTNSLDRHLPMSSDLTQAASATDMSPPSRSTPGSIASHHSTPVSGSGSMIEMVAAAAAAAANSTSDAVMHSPLAAQSTVSSRLLESSSGPAVPLDNSPKPQLSPAAAIAVTSPAGSSHSSPVVGGARGPPPLAMPPGAVVSTPTVTSTPPGVPPPSTSTSTASSGQRSSHKGSAPPGMLPNHAQYLSGYMPVPIPPGYADFDAMQQRGLGVGREGNAPGYQAGGDSKFPIDPSSSTASAMSQAGAAGSMNLYAAQQQLLAYYATGMFPPPSFMMPQIPYGAMYAAGSYPPGGMQGKGHFGPGGAFIPQFPGGMTGSYEDEYKSYQATGSQGQGKGTSTSVSYTSSSGSGLAGSGYKGQYDSGKAGYQSNSSPGLFGMAPGGPGGVQSGAGIPNYPLPTAHGQLMMPPNLPPPQGAGQAIHSHQSSNYHHGIMDSGVGGSSHLATGPGQSSRSAGVSQHMHSSQQGKHHQLGGKQQFPGWQG